MPDTLTPAVKKNVVQPHGMTPLGHHIASIGIVDPHTGDSWLLDASLISLSNGRS